MLLPVVSWRTLPRISGVVAAAVGITIIIVAIMGAKEVAAGAVEDGRKRIKGWYFLMRRRGFLSNHGL